MGLCINKSSLAHTLISGPYDRNLSSHHLNTHTHTHTHTSCVPSTRLGVEGWRRAKINFRPFNPHDVIPTVLGESEHGNRSDDKLARAWFVQFSDASN